MSGERQSSMPVRRVGGRKVAVPVMEKLIVHSNSSQWISIEVFSTSYITQ